MAEIYVQTSHFGCPEDGFGMIYSDSRSATFLEGAIGNAIACHTGKGRYESNGIANYYF